MNTGLTLTLGSWTRLELCTRTAADGYLQLKVDGVAGPVWNGNMGTTNPGAIEIGDAAANSWTANYDDIVVTDPTLLEPRPRDHLQDSTALATRSVPNAVGIAR